MTAKSIAKWVGIVTVLCTALATLVTIFQAIKKSPDVAVSGTNNLGIGSMSGGQINIGATELKADEARALLLKEKDQFEAIRSSAQALNGERFCKSAFDRAEKLSADARSALAQERYQASRELFAYATVEATSVLGTLKSYKQTQESLIGQIERKKKQIEKPTRRNQSPNSRKNDIDEADQLSERGSLVEALAILDPQGAKRTQDRIDRFRESMRNGCVSFQEYIVASIAK